MSGQFVSYCSVAEDIVALDPKPDDPVRLWLDALPEAGVTEPMVLEIANEAAAAAGTAKAYEILDRRKQEVSKGSFDELGCDDLEELLTTSKPPGPPGSAKMPVPAPDDDEDDESED